MMQTLSAVITVSPDIMHGEPVFAGTRVPITSVFDYLTTGETIDDFLDGFPSVSREQVTQLLDLMTENQ